ncbi:MAG: lytic murein transglycosylase [Candidatus Uhrbacteria bacterium]|nr:lytic murein transglycosylase [Candidatus Uhrbacteria bacterium]
MSFKRSLIALVFVLVLLLGFTSRFVFADDSMQAVEAEKSQLQSELDQIEAQIAQFQKELVNIKGEKNTLTNKIKQLKAQQATLALRIKETALEVQDMDHQITATKSLIDKNQVRTEALKAEVAESLRQMNTNDHRTFLFVFFSEHTLFDALSEVQQFTQVTSGLDVLLDQLHKTREDLSAQKTRLDAEQDHVENLLAVQTLQQQALTGSVKDQATLLTQTKGKEKNYQASLTDSQKQAAQIRTRLYQLLDVGKQITFGQAVDIATWVSKQTGVRASFLLAILTQESSLGKNVGTCNRPGDPVSKSWKTIMKPERDQEPFKTITAELGMDPDTTAVSCPMHDKKGNQIGWGGAMGPAQFIPSTWMGYRAKVTNITGKVANPWDIRDAFIASAIKLGADGATTKDGEWAAAMRYFSGSTNVRFRFYGDQVVAQAEAYQKDMEALGK